MEKKVRNGMLMCDLYVKDIDLLIDLHGPCHYLQGTHTPIDSAMYVDRIYKKYHKHYIAVHFEKILMHTDMEEKSQNECRTVMKDLIDTELRKK